MAQAGMMFVLAVFLQATHHLTPVSAGRRLLPVGLAVLVGTQIGSRIAGKLGPTIVVRSGILVQLAGVATGATILRPDTEWAVLAVALGLFGLGAGMASSQLTNVILSEVPRERAGSASGLATTNNSLGAAIGVAILGSVLRVGVLTDAGSARWALLAGAALLVAGLAASLAIPPRATGWALIVQIDHTRRSPGERCRGVHHRNAAERRQQGAEASAETTGVNMTMLFDLAWAAGLVCALPAESVDCWRCVSIS
jgi:MFS family permease